MNRRLKIIFTMSLLLNVLLIGVVAGSAYKRMDRYHGFSESRNPQVNSKIAKAMRDTRKEQDAVHLQMKSAKQDLFKVLSAPTLNEDAFNEASEKMAAAQAALFKARHEATLKMAREMSVAERQALADHMKAMSERHGKFRTRHGDKLERLDN